MSQTTTQYIFAFGNKTAEGDPQRKDLLGGKGASLAAMSQAGLPVPPGFTITAECCPYVEQHGGKWPEGLKDQVNRYMAQLEKLSGRTFGRGPKPLLVAVRSGAAVSMPGMMDTILNCGMHPDLADAWHDREKFWDDYADHIRMFSSSVAGLSLSVNGEATGEAKARAMIKTYADKTGRPFPVDPYESLYQCIDAVFSSWNSERAITYRKHHDIRGVVGTAVNVQMMFPSQRAGVLFTANPNDINAGEMVLEASWGLGEAVVSGAVTPDIYVLDDKTLLIKSEVQGDRPGNEPALTPAEVHRVAELGRQVEQYFGVPCDIEWGLADGDLVLLQSRAIRGLDVLRDVEVGRLEEIQRLKGLANGQQAVWVVHNLDETLKNPTPLTWDIIRWFMSGQGGYGQMYRDFGYKPSQQVCRDGFLELICGRIFVDPNRAAGMFWGDIPQQYSLADILEDDSTLERAPNKLDVQRIGPVFFAKLPAWIVALIRCGRKMKKARRQALERFEGEILPPFLDFVTKARAADLIGLTTAQVIAELDRRIDYVMGRFAAESLKPGFFGGLAQGRMLTLLAQLMGDADGEDLGRVLTTGLEHDTTVEQNIWLHRVAHGKAKLGEFIERFGHRTTGEMELAQPRWREDSTYIQRMAENFRTAEMDPEQRHHEQQAAREQAAANLRDKLAEFGGASLYERIRDEMVDAQRMLPYREVGKHYLMMGYETIRLAITELGRRWNLGRDVFFLHRDELAGYESQRDALAERIAQRKVRWESARKLSLTAVINSEQLDGLGKPAPLGEGGSDKELPARPIASGTSTGIARLVFDPQQAGDLGSDYILVCPSTDPGWTPLFVNARGLIVERGGILSHGAIVARDFGIPAVVLENATQRIADKSRITIDGTRGLVVRL